MPDKPTHGALKQRVRKNRGVIPAYVFTAFLNAVCIICSILFFAATALADHQNRVLFISAYHPGFPTFSQQVNGIKTVFDKNNILLDIEFMDSKRFPIKANGELFQKSLNLKLKRTDPYDAIIVADDNALIFAIENQNQLFENIPIVFMGVNDIEKALSQNSNPQITGVIEAVSVSETIELMITFCPKASRIIAIVDDTPSGQSDLKTFYKSSEHFESHEFTEISLSSMTWTDFLTKLGTIDEKSAILLLSAYKDKNNRTYTFEESLKKIRGALNLPIFHLWRHGIGQGLIGGKVISHFEQGKAAAHITRKILSGTPVSKIDIMNRSPNKYVFDYLELQKHHMDQTLIPKGSLILNQPDSFYSKNRKMIWAIAATFVVLSLALLVSVANILKRLKFEKDLKKSESKYRTILKSAMDGFWLTDTNGRLLEVNDAYCRMSGYGEAELRSMNISELEIVETPERVARHMDKIVSTGSDRFESKHRRKDGTVFDVEISVQFRTDDRGHCICFLHDITDRKQAEESLQEAKTFLDNMSDLAYVADDQGNVRWVNTVAERMTGLPRDQIIGKPFSPLFIDSDKASLMDVYQRSLNGEALENTLTFTTGVTCHFTSLPKRTGQGEVIGTFGVARDITERLRLEQALRDSEQMYRTTFDAIPDSITVTRQTDGRYKYVNDGFCRITGYSRDEVIGKTPVEINLYVDRSDREKMIQTLRHSGELLNFEIPFRKKDNTIWDSFFSARPIVIDGEGCLIALTKDVTQLKRAEAEKARLESQLRQAQKMESIGRLAGGVAHDFNNMLGVIIGHADMSLEGMDPKHPLHAMLVEIKNAGMRSADLTRQLLAFARKQTVSPKVLELNATVEGMTKMLQRLIGEGIDLAWKPGRKLWPVKMDPSQIDQILANLCVNARDAIMDVGQITIETGTATFDEAYCNSHAGFLPGDYVWLSVNDNGCGMDGETIENIFEPFYTTKESGKGTGLGLATVYGTVRQNKGFIKVNSEPGHGSAFKVYLPRHVAHGGDRRTDMPDRPLVGGRETVLLVEDDPGILRMTTMMLEKLGYQVVPASTPGKAIDLAQTYAGDIHLILTDIIMPKMNGRDLAKTILSSRPDIKRLFMSGYTADVIAHHGVLDEGVNFIQKPFSKAMIGAKLRELLDEPQPRKPDGPIGLEV